MLVNELRLKKSILDSNRVYVTVDCEVFFKFDNKEI
jgi:hypothetical protein